MKFRKFAENILEEMGQQYRTLNDAAIYFPELAKGNTEIWYQSHDFFRDGGMGVKWLKKQDILPDPKEFPMGRHFEIQTGKEKYGQTHILLGKIKETDPEKIFMMMQGERWSPKGEARSLIKRLSLWHTSMSVGDIIKVKNKYLIADNFGFVKL